VTFPLLALVATALAVPLVEWDLETDDGGFESGGETGQWAWGPVESGPHSSVDGVNAWSTVLSGPHLNDTTDTLRLPTFDLTGVPRPVLSFAHWYALDTGGQGDTARVEVFDGLTWSTVTPVYDYPVPGGWQGASNGWLHAWFDLTGVSDTADVRLVIATDRSVALDGWTIDDVVVFEGDAIPPEIRTVAGPSDSSDLFGPYPVSADVIDDIEVLEVTVVWKTGDGETSRAPLSPSSGPRWAGGIDAVAPGTDVTWWLEATDGINATKSGERGFRVFLPSPIDLWGPEGRVVATEVDIGWSAPDTDLPVLGYRVWTDEALVAETAATEWTLALTSRDPVVEVSALFETPFGPWEGDRSEPLALDVAVPTLTAVTPEEAFQGDRLRVVIEGRDLLLVQGEAEVEGGSGVVVEAIDVEDVNRASVTIRVEPGAQPGARDLVLHTGDLTIVDPNGFTVLDGADRPAIVEIEPGSLLQGAHADVTLTLSDQPANEAVDVDFGEGVIVESVVADGLRITATVAVALHAPVGARAVVVDDGTRFVDGVELRIAKPSAPATRVCGSVPRPLGGGGRAGLSPMVLAALAGLVAVGRRRRRAQRSASAD
jgi:hypothetical protein